MADLSATLAPPERVDLDPPHVSTTRKRLPRWAAILIWTFVVGSVGALVLREVLVRSHDPFEWGSSFLHVQIDGVPTHEVEGVDTHGSYPEPMEVVRVPFHEGKRLRFAFAFRNAGPWRVTLEEVALGPRAPMFATLLQPEGVLIAQRPGWTHANQARPFEPTSFAPGEERLVVFDYQLVCQRGGAVQLQIRDDVDVRFEMFGRSEWQTIPLPFRLLLTYPAKGSCTPLH